MAVEKFIKEDIVVDEIEKSIIEVMRKVDPKLKCFSKDSENYNLVIEYITKLGEVKEKYIDYTTYDKDKFNKKLEKCKDEKYETYIVVIETLRTLYYLFINMELKINKNLFFLTAYAKNLVENQFL